METIRLTLTEAELRQLVKRCCNPRGEGEDFDVLLSAIGKLYAAMERTNRRRNTLTIIHGGETNEEVQ